MTLYASWLELNICINQMISRLSIFMLWSYCKKTIKESNKISSFAVLCLLPWHILFRKTWKYNQNIRVKSYGYCSLQGLQNVQAFINITLYNSYERRYLQSKIIKNILCTEMTFGLITSLWLFKDHIVFKKLLTIA